MKKILPIILCSLSFLLSCLSTPREAIEQKPVREAAKREPVLTNFEKGLLLFEENKMREALPHFEKALKENPLDEEIYVYIGLIYEQLGNTQKAIQIIKRGLLVASRSDYRAILYFNLGNNYFRQEEYAIAEQMYSKALEINSQYAPTYLNRANTRLEQKKYPEARQDYIDYLRLKPNSSQRKEIENMISLLGQHLADSKIHERGRIKKDLPVLSVLDFKIKDISKSDGELIVELLSAALLESGKFRIIEKSERESILKEIEYSLSDSVDKESQIQIGTMLAADLIMTGSVGKIGNRFVLSVKLLDVELGETVSSALGLYRTIDQVVDDCPNIASTITQKAFLPDLVK